MTDEYVELFLKWAKGESPEVKSWLERKGLSTIPMKDGLLVSGSRDQVEKAFAVSLENRELPFTLPIPKDLAPHLASIILPRSRSYHR